MTKEDYQFLENTLRGLALFIAERKEQEQWFIDEKKKADFRRLFFIVGSEEPAPAPKPTAAPMRNVKPEALQPNKSLNEISQHNFVINNCNT